MARTKNPQLMTVVGKSIVTTTTTIEELRHTGALPEENALGVLPGEWISNPAWEVSGSCSFSLHNRLNSEYIPIKTQCVLTWEEKPKKS
ncbi:hypothetical protein E2562_000043 [Oryza meyeriana var. granulata]|uniref:Uncharacterized protein n=1 Tax=Oryza meyeriana var. granulata TaxID=110450 RepID=A0A6G1DBB6_9ORYZ|nr:hypothetical protein E2562_000043 [Oryza meyeriana var. granulata]